MVGTHRGMRGQLIIFSECHYESLGSFPPNQYDAYIEIGHVSCGGKIDPLLFARSDKGTCFKTLAASVIGEIDKIHGSTNDVYLSVKVGQQMTTRCISQGTNYVLYLP